MELKKSPISDLCLLDVWEDHSCKYGVSTYLKLRDLHDFLEIKNEYCKWSKSRLERSMFVEGNDYIKVKEGKEINHYVYTEVAMFLLHHEIMVQNITTKKMTDDDEYLDEENRLVNLYRSIVRVWENVDSFSSKSEHEVFSMCFNDEKFLELCKLKSEREMEIRNFILHQKSLKHIEEKYQEALGQIEESFEDKRDKMLKKMGLTKVDNIIEELAQEQDIKDKEVKTFFTKVIGKLPEKDKANFDLEESFNSAIEKIRKYQEPKSIFQEALDEIARVREIDKLNSSSLNIEEFKAKFNKFQEEYGKEKNRDESTDKVVPVSSSSLCEKDIESYVTPVYGLTIELPVDAEEDANDRQEV